MKKALLLAVCFSHMGFGFYFADPDPIVKLLQEQQGIFLNVARDIEKPHLGRLVRFSKVVDRLLELVKNPTDVVSYVNELKKFGVVFDRLDDVKGIDGLETYGVLTLIQTDFTADGFKRVAEIAKQIKTTYKLDTESKTTVTEAMATELTSAISAILVLKPNEFLKKELEAIHGDLPALIGAARVKKDGWEIYEQAIPYCQRIQALYPAFYDLDSVSETFNAAMELQGINEEMIQQIGIQKALIEREQQPQKE